MRRPRIIWPIAGIAVLLLAIVVGCAPAPTPTPTPAPKPAAPAATAAPRPEGTRPAPAAPAAAPTAAAPKPGPGGTPPTTVRFARGIPVFPYASMEVAEDKGFFKDEGIVPDITQLDGVKSMQALTGGQVDAAFIFLTERPEEAMKLIQPRYKGLNAQTLAEASGLMKGAYPRDALSTPAEWQQALKLYGEVGIVKGTLDPKEGGFWTNKYLKDIPKN